MSKKLANISLTNNEKLAMISNLSTLLTAGIPILEAVELMLEDAKGNPKLVLQSLYESLVQGKHIYAALSEFPKSFDKVTVNLLKASEEAGTLETILKDLKDQIKKQMEFSDRLRSALIYPMFITLVFFGVMLMILIVVIPKINTVFSRLNVSIPVPTKILIFLSSILLTYPVFVTAGAIIFIGSCIWIIKTQKQFIYPMLFSLPLISNLIQEIDLTRFSRNLYLLLSAGITITNALELTEEVVMRKDVAKAIRYAKETVLNGKSLSDAFKQRKTIFTGIMIKIIEAGERTGTLDKSMLDISEYLDYEVSNTVKTLTTVLEPVMLILVGVLVGGMMMSIIAPIYSLIGQVSH